MTSPSVPVQPLTDYRKSSLRHPGTPGTALAILLFLLLLAEIACPVVMQKWIYVFTLELQESIMYSIF